MHLIIKFFHSQLKLSFFDHTEIGLGINYTENSEMDMRTEEYRFTRKLTLNIVFINLSLSYYYLHE